MRGSIVLLFGLAAAACQHRRSAAVRHAILAMAIAASIAVVPLGQLLPSWEVEIPRPAADAQIAAPAGAAASVAPPISAVAAASPTAPRTWPLLMLLWLAGVAAGGLRLAAGVGRLAWLARRAAPLHDCRWQFAAATISKDVGLSRPVTLLQADVPETLGTWGLRRPHVLLPRDAGEWTDERMLVVLRHELAHVRRHDWIVQLLAEAARAICWFNPLMWLACARLRREGEQACDDVVLAGGVEAPVYATHLLDLTRRYRAARTPWASPVSMARPSTLERRIAAMLNATLNRKGLSTRAMLLAAAALAAVAVPSAVLRATQGAPLPLTGLVYDATGAVLPEVKLTLEDAQRVKTEATTDASGQFQFPPVPSGKYTLEAALPGFKPLRQSVTLSTARDWKRVVMLQVGEVQEEISVRASRIAGARPQGSAASAVAAPVRVGGNIRPPRKVRHVSPVYPASMREAGLEGLVPMEAIIAADGKVQSVRVLTAEIHPDLAQAAVEAVKQWQFEPTLLNGAAVEVVMNVSVSFTLSD